MWKLYIREYNLFYKCRQNQGIFFEIIHWPFKLPPNLNWPANPSGWIYWCMSALPSKGQCRNSKIFLPFVLFIRVVKNIFFPETYNASTFLSLNLRCARNLIFKLNLACWKKFWFTFFNIFHSIFCYILVNWRSMIVRVYFELVDSIFNLSNFTWGH